VTRIALQVQVAVAARVMTLGEGISMLVVVMIATFLFTKNQHVINNLVVKK
jgi:hypothetical protein